MQLSPQNLANPTGQFWRAGVGYVGQHGVARGGTQRQLVRASIAAALGGGRWEEGGGVVGRTAAAGPSCCSPQPVCSTVCAPWLQLAKK